MAKSKDELRQTIHNTQGLRCPFHAFEEHLSHSIDDFAQVAPAPIESALTRQYREQMRVPAKFREQLGFNGPPLTFRNQYHSD